MRGAWQGRGGRATDSATTDVSGLWAGSLPSQQAPGGYPQPYMPGYQQYYQPVQPQVQQGFYPQQGYPQPTYRQQAPMPASAPAATPAPLAAPAPEQQPPAWTAELGRINLSDRSQTILEYLSAHEMVGPTELVRTYGRSAPRGHESLPTWYRWSPQEVGQKYYLTQLGQNFV